MFDTKGKFYIDYVSNRANLELNWSGYDIPENYKKSTNKGLNLYSETDINYKYNSHGFRCDEFNLDSKFPILYTGCSFTEGTGLPLESVWAKKLHTKIENRMNMKIPYWNLALSGASLDVIANSLYWFFDTLKFTTVKYICILCPPFSRREYFYKTYNSKIWYHPKSPGVEDDSNIVDNLFSDFEFKKYQSLKNLALISSVARSVNAKIVLCQWVHNLDIENLDIPIIKSNFVDFAYINYPNPNLNVDLARDSTHPGPTLHEHICNKFYEEFFSRLKYDR